MNVMPCTVTINLGFTEFKPIRNTLILTHRSVWIPEGILEDMPIRICDCLIFIYFVILKYGQEPNDPFILGRPFLATVGANFNTKQFVKRPMIDCQTFFLDHFTELAKEFFREMFSTDPLETTVTDSVMEAMHLDDRAAEYIWLMDTNDEVMHVLAKKMLGMLKIVD